jgi:hypothetical protein
MSKHKKWRQRATARRQKQTQKKLQQKNGRSNKMVYNPNSHKEWKKPAVVEEEYWEIEIECVDACGKAPKEMIVWIRPLAKVKIDALMEKYPSIEWFSYLLGELKADFGYIVDDIYIPKQTVTGTSVDEIDAPDFNKLPVIGALHSHHGMGNGFSGTDHKYVNGNHNISLVISKDGVAGQVRWQTPCGALKIIDAKVKPLMEVDFNKEDFLKAETEKINEKSYTYTPGTHVGSGVNYNDYNNNRVFPTLNQQEQDLVDELDVMDGVTSPATSVPKTGADVDAAIDKKNNEAYEKSVKGDDWVNEDQSLTDALKEAFGE